MRGITLPARREVVSASNFKHCLQLQATDINLPFSNEGQYKEHPNMNAYNQYILEQYFSQYKFAKIERSVNHYEGKL